MLPSPSSRVSLSARSSARRGSLRRCWSVLGGCCLAGLAACSDSSTYVSLDTDTGAGPNGGAERAESAAVVAILTRGPDDTFQTYMLASEAAPSGMLDLSGALELPDALVTQNDEAIFVGDNERIVLQRYEVNADYSFA